MFSAVDRKKIVDKFKEYNNLRDEIDKKFADYAPLINHSPSPSENTLEDKFGNQIVIKEYGNNSEYMQKRTRDLEDAKIISAQVAEISSSIKIEVAHQGEVLNEVENNVSDMNKNLELAHKEAKETEIITKKSKKTLYVVGSLLLFVLGILGFGIWKLVVITTAKNKK